MTNISLIPQNRIVDLESNIQTINQNITNLQNEVISNDQEISTLNTNLSQTNTNVSNLENNLNMKIQLVSSLPSSPISGILYCIPE